MPKDFFRWEEGGQLGEFDPFLSFFVYSKLGVGIDCENSASLLGVPHAVDQQAHSAVLHQAPSRVVQEVPLPAVQTW